MAADALRLATLRFYEEILDAVWGPALATLPKIGFERVRHQVGKNHPPSLKAIWEDCPHRVVKADPNGRDRTSNWLFASVGITTELDDEDSPWVVKIWARRENLSDMNKTLKGLGDWGDPDDHGWAAITPCSRFSNDFTSVDPTGAVTAAASFASAPRSA